MKRRSAWIGSVLSTVALVGLVSGCGAATTANNATGSAPKSQVKVGLITDIGGLNDHSFNQNAYIGLQRAEKELGIQGRVVQSQSANDYVPNLRNFAQQGDQLVIAVGYLMEDAVKQVAPEYPNTKFLILDDSIPNIPNVAGAVFKTEQSAYLAGAMAGLMEQKSGIPKMNSQNVVGVVAGMKIPPVEEYVAGFQQGFHKTDPHGTLLIRWTNSFTDQALGNQVAKDEIASGADIVYQLAGAAGIGAIQAANQAGVYAIGADADQSFLAENAILTSTLKRIDVATFDIIKDVTENRFTAGTHWFDLAGQGVGLTNFNAVVPQDVRDQVNQLADEIKSGKLKVSAQMQ
ncbi:BMP family ABC transporter substrate-binding protein [Alicyclobacillus contaminans]|uniref:BMP family lipoprotein n=1 Tax=Alicyclobacillus contaminans TaxID=392016 RepID=UPI00047BA55C|nr:BMP family ABC transporter substrate-binding protein [Alicyclobacillus contaminans]GMA51086.1 BMP family ABC transporter substrate-binding protein [Alicyclobacillus contaminans]